MRPLKTRTEMFELLDESGELKAMSASVAQLLKMTKSPDCAIENIVQVVRRDQGLALKVLRLSNSSAYVRGEPLASVEKAVVRVGLSAIGQMITNIAVIDQFSEQPDGCPLDLPNFWEHAIGCGLIASELAGRLGDPQLTTDDLFTMGLLHDLGKLIFHQSLGEEYLQVIDVAQVLQLPVEQVESRLLMLNHADAMNRLLHRWGFPKSFIDPITYHHLSADNIRQTTPHSITQTSVLALANHLAHALVLGGSGNDMLHPIHEYLDILQLPETVISELEAQIPSQCEDLRFGLLSGLLEKDDWTCKIDEYKNTLNQPLCPLVISDHQETDVVRIFLDRLRDTDTDTDTDAPQNVAIVIISDANQQTELSERLLREEAEAGGRALPTLIFANSEKLTLQGKAAERRSKSVTFPVEMLDVIQLLNALLAEEPIGQAA